MELLSMREYMEDAPQQHIFRCGRSKRSESGKILNLSSGKVKTLRSFIRFPFSGI
jgi:hypothetical protein